MNCKAWLGGIISAASGAVGAVGGAIFAAPESFNATPEGLHKIAIVAGVSAAVAVANFLKKSPLPGVCEDKPTP